MDDLDFQDIDALFKENDFFDTTDEVISILFIGPDKTYRDFIKIIKNDLSIKCSHVEIIDDAIILLLQKIFAIVILDNEGKNMDIVTVSRVVRFNHPLARIVVFSTKKEASFIIDIVNKGAVDAFLLMPLNKDELKKKITEQKAKHDISKMMTSFITQPPKLSKASYLLLDPSLSLEEESSPIQFIGIMITYNSVPRYSRFFENLLAKDEVLFASFLSGITMLGNELFSSKKPLQSINFGGVSVTFRFYGNLQISIFVRNLSSYNYDQAENIVSTIANEINEKVGNYIKLKKAHIAKKEQEIIVEITDKLIEANQSLKDNRDTEPEIEKQGVLLYGIDEEQQIRFKKYLERKGQYEVMRSNKEEDTYKIIKNTNCNVILLDSGIKKQTSSDPFDFAEHAKEILPSIQIIYRVRDQRSLSHMIKALNCEHIDFMLPYRSAFKDYTPWIIKAIEKSKKIKKLSITAEDIDKTIDQATIAKTIIRKDEMSYRPENKPFLLVIFIALREIPIFHTSWGEKSIKLDFDQAMMAGLVAALDNVGDEMFYEGKSIGGLELGGAKILIQQRDKFNYVFFVKNIGPNTSVVVNKELIIGANKLHEIVVDVIDDIQSIDQSVEIKKILEKTCNQIYDDFDAKFTRDYN